MLLTTPSVDQSDLATAAKATVRWFRLIALKAHSLEIRTMTSCMQAVKSFLEEDCDNITLSQQAIEKAETAIERVKIEATQARYMVLLSRIVYDQLLVSNPDDTFGSNVKPKVTDQPVSKEEEALRMLIIGGGYVGLARMAVASFSLENLSSIEYGHALDEAWKAVGYDFKEVFIQLGVHLHIGTQCRRCIPYEIPGSVQASWNAMSAAQIAAWFASY